MTRRKGEVKSRMRTKRWKFCEAQKKKKQEQMWTKLTNQTDGPTDGVTGACNIKE